MPNPKILVASAGTGKTTALMKVLETLFSQGARPEDIACTTFTKAGAEEIVERVVQNHPEFNPDRFKGFSTIHAMAYRRIPRKKLVNHMDLKIMGRELGIPITGASVINQNDGGIKEHMAKGDKLLHLESIWRNRLCNPETIIHEQQDSAFSVSELVDFSKAYRNYRESIGKYDYTDMLEVYAESLESGRNPGFTYALVDEAQDLSALQWKVARALFDKSVSCYVAGDDKQALYAFSGGDPTELINQEGDRDVLDTTYRVPSVILDYAEEVAQRISDKQEYTVKSKNAGGEVKRITSLHGLPFDQGTWFLLVRNRALSAYFEGELTKLGVLYSAGSGSAITPDLIEAVLTWNLLGRGKRVPMKHIKYAYDRLLPTGKVIARGYKKVMAMAHDEDMVTYTQLEKEYGLKQMDRWTKLFNLSDEIKNLLLTAESKNQLNQGSRVTIGTIHSVKGKEADHVVVLPDMVALTNRSFNTNPDNEHRVFYVATTRSKQTLYLHEPITDRFYPMP